MTNKLMIGAVAVALAAGLAAQAADKGKRKVDVSKLPPAAQVQDVTYATQIRSIFEKSCFKCHGTDKPKAKLRLDSLAGALKGSENGKVVLPGDGAGSVLLHNIAQIGDPDEYMPPPRNKAGIPKLSIEQVALIRAWIDQGAK